MRIVCRFIISFCESILYLIWHSDFNINNQSLVMVLVQLLFVVAGNFPFLLFATHKHTHTRFSIHSICHNIILYYWIQKITEIKEEVAKNVTWKCHLFYRIQRYSLVFLLFFSFSLSPAHSIELLLLVMHR